MRLLLIVLAFTTLVVNDVPQAFAADNGDAAEAASEEGEEEEDAKTIDETVEDLERMPGLFTLYRDSEDGSMMMEISADQLDKDYIYLGKSADGVVAAGHFRGAYRDQAVFQLRRYFDRIEFVERNTGFYFDPANALSRAARANISDAVLSVNEIVATDEEETRFLIKLDEVLLSESLHKVKPNSDPDRKGHEQFNLGKLDSKKTRYGTVSVYPENINIVVNYVFNNASPYVRGGQEVTDPRAVTIAFEHMFIEAPDNDYALRLDDARVGYFFDQVTDLTSHEITPYRDLINRWHLVKKDPAAEISEPVEPIVWWIENTTPVEYRDVIRRGVLAWNEAFEQAGFKNAIVVREQPDDAEWDAGDIRYNVLRWTSSPTPPFGGYGPSFSDPRTGQIIGADIMLENVYVSNRVRYSTVFGESHPALPVHSHDSHARWQLCSAGMNIAHGITMAKNALMAAGGTDADMSKMVEQGLYELALHEVGHTLGLNHNMRASQLHTPEDIHNPEKTQGILIGSVMDYGSVNLAPPGVEQGDYYSVRPGPYDVWAIQFGYSPELEGEARADHLARSTEPELAFGNDADDMRSAGRAIDPRVMIGDMSSDAIAYAEGRFALTRDLMADLNNKLAFEGESWARVRDAYLVLTREQRNKARVVSRYVGGVKIDRGVVGQPGSTQPYTPIAGDRQREAMAVLAENVFAADAFEVPAEVVAHLGMQRRGFNHFGMTEDPKVHDRALAIQKDVLDHLMHPNVLERLTDTQLYGNEYSVNEMLSDLTSAVFEDDLRDSVNSFRQNLQVEFTHRLLGVVGEGGSSEYDHISRAAALTQLERIETWMKQGARRGDASSVASRRYVLHLIEQGLDRA